MARVLGWGGIANTNGARDFSAKETATVVTSRVQRGSTFLLLGTGISLFLAAVRVLGAF